MFDKIKKLIKGAEDATGQHATMKACMMGPRAVGKTTILTAIFHNTSQSIAQTPLKFVPDSDTLTRMNLCSNQLTEIFEKRFLLKIVLQQVFLPRTKFMYSTMSLA